MEVEPQRRVIERLGDHVAPAPRVGVRGQLEQEAALRPGGERGGLDEREHEAEREDHAGADEDPAERVEQRRAAEAEPGDELVREERRQEHEQGRRDRDQRPPLWAARHAQALHVGRGDPDRDRQRDDGPRRAQRVDQARRGADPQHVGRARAGALGQRAAAHQQRRGQRQQEEEPADDEREHGDHRPLERRTQAAEGEREADAEVQDDERPVGEDAQVIDQRRIGALPGEPPGREREDEEQQAEAARGPASQPQHPGQQRRGDEISVVRGGRRRPAEMVAGQGERDRRADQRYQCRDGIALRGPGAALSSRHSRRRLVEQILARLDGIELVGTCADGDALRQAVVAEQPDVVITDIRMPPSGDDEGIRVARFVRERYPDMGVVVLSQYADFRYGFGLVEDGAEARAYLLKDRVRDPAELRTAIEVIARGGSMIDPTVVRQLLQAEQARDR